jgi:CelD/BcsL family acetyltransferase involved in cellulose biosynthesis
VSGFEIRVYRGFDDPDLNEADWQRLHAASARPEVFMTWAWQRAWWHSFGRGRLLLVGAVRGRRPVMLAPMFADDGMLFPVGSGGSDYLDLLGDTGRIELLEAMLKVAADQTPGFLGFRFYHLPAGSPNLERLRQAGQRLGMSCHDEGSLPAPLLRLDHDPGAARRCADKHSLLRHTRYFERRGRLEVHHLIDGKSILPHLEDFFEQHVKRWQETEHPSLFLDPVQREFYRHLTTLAADSGWLRFTRVVWEGRPIAYHFGFHYRGRYLWYKPSFEIELARRSPGEVLLRQLLLAAEQEGAAMFDFGLGDEPFKQRFASSVEQVHTLGLYPRESLRELV